MEPSPLAPELAAGITWSTRNRPQPPRRLVLMLSRLGGGPPRPRPARAAPTTGSPARRHGHLPTVRSVDRAAPGRAGYRLGRRAGLRRATAILERRLAIMAGGSDDDLARPRPSSGGSARGPRRRARGPGTRQARQPARRPAHHRGRRGGARVRGGCGLDLELVRDALRGGSADCRVLQVHGAA